MDSGVVKESVSASREDAVAESGDEYWESAITEALVWDFPRPQVRKEQQHVKAAAKR